MTEIKKNSILVAVSSPWATEKFVESISDVALRFEATVVVVHVSQSAEEDDNESDAKERGELTLETLTVGLEKKGIDAMGVRIVSDDVSRAILNVADEHEARFIVMGITARSWWSRLFSTDIPTRVAHHARVPVIMLPPAWRGLI